MDLQAPFHGVGCSSSPGSDMEMGGKEEAMSEEEAGELAQRLALGSVLPMALKTVVELGVLELMAGHELTPEELTAQLPTNNPDAPAMLDRILRLLASRSLLTCTSTTDVDGKVQRRYGLAPACKLLVPNRDGASLSHLLLLSQCKAFMESWYHLKDAVLEANGVPFNRAHGMGFYDHLPQDPCLNELFNSAMQNHSTVVTKKILEVYDGFHGIRSVVDVGGGTGANLSLITGKYPGIKAVNFDLPHVVQKAPEFPGVEHVGGDMFSSVPAGDAIFMKTILLNWGDDRCLKLLGNCWKALPENGKVIVVEMIVPEIVENSSASSSVFQLDLLMLTVLGGKLRTEKELEVLARAAGFTGIKSICSALDFWVIEFYKGSTTAGE
ncbi:caffeic acid 3-O-methyltransferase-like isoform X2 [Nymphaea colorata]|uniref:caffeic acid 3-O-methyltransferase-like isoform X2 n=1 Tax=Nymphaea colorata TaxID=210225 RepID=UPI00129E71D6|nr:caffeic acid 3-O-methyltransferase-like isoform X2 [Nymphaea colorata]